MFLLFHIQYHTIEATFKIFMSINDLKISINKLHISNKLHQYIYFFWCYNCLSIFPQYINLPIKNISKNFSPTFIVHFVRLESYKKDLN